jgi:RNA polymerase sigma factor (sigma-70 family)
VSDVLLARSDTSRATRARSFGGTLGQRVRSAERVGEEDDEFLAGLYKQEAGALVGLMFVYCRDRSVAEEVVQEAFLRLRVTLDRVQDRGRAASYVRSTAFNLARSRFRHQAVADRHRPAPPGTASSPEDAYVLREDQRAVVAALGHLSDKQRACLVLRFYEDLSEREIAVTLAMSPNSVKTHVRRGMAALSRLLGDPS